jgi:hypothetical protein
VNTETKAARKRTDSIKLSLMCRVRLFFSRVLVVAGSAMEVWAAVARIEDMEFYAL